MPPALPRRSHPLLVMSPDPNGISPAYAFLTYHWFDPSPLRLSDQWPTKNQTFPAR
jgi:hypothetical protein